MTVLGICAIIICSAAALMLLIVGGIAIWKAQGGHTCRGPETGRRFVPGAIDSMVSFKLPGMPNEHDLRVVYGYTEISYKCSTCGAPFNNRILGKVNDE